MRNKEQKWLLGALACALALPFTGCSNDDEPIPGGGGNGEKYNTEFTVAFTKNGASTRATDTEVGNGDFQGMTNIRLLAFTGADGTSHKVLSNSTLNSENTLGDIPAASGNNAFVQKYNISLNEATVSFLFYGESAYSGGVGALTPSYTTGQADGTTFSLTELADNSDVSAMTNYIQSVVLAVETNMKTGDDAVKTQLTNFFAACTSPGLYQVAYMMAQLYLAENLYTETTGLAAVKNAIVASGGSPVFTGLDASKTSISEIMACVNTANENYLGEGYPKGGKVLTISNFASDDNDVSVTIAEAATNATTYYQPTSLWYYANTYPVAYNNEAANNWGSISSIFVNLNTQPTSAIALYDQIQYAVGQLDLTVKVKDEITGNDDDAGTQPPAGDNFTTPISAEDIQLMGVIVNNQKEVGWEFQPSTTGDNSTHAAYDQSGITNPSEDASSGTSDKTMKMLALPTKAGGEVEIVLEMKNNSDNAFKGVNGGIIPAKATFYVLAKLNPNDGRLVEGGTAVDNPAVFMSDYLTTVTLNLNSLKSAYQTVPDLSASNLEFALSVDLSWEQGYSFDVDIE